MAAAFCQATVANDHLILTFDHVDTRKYMYTRSEYPPRTPLAMGPGC